MGNAPSVCAVLHGPDVGAVVKQFGDVLAQHHSVQRCVGGGQWQPINTTGSLSSGFCGCDRCHGQQRQHQRR